MKNKKNNADYPFVTNYSKLHNIPEEILIEAFKVEAHYHKLLLDEKNYESRQLIYGEFYSKLIPIYGRHENLVPEVNSKDKYVKLFSKELEKKSIIDFGCGQGYMLQSIAQNIDVRELSGVDVFIPEGLKNNQRIDFIESNIVEFVSPKPFDIAISDNVLEHLVFQDAEKHVQNIAKSLNEHGQLILFMPNRLFGPSDITRIKDFSHSGSIDALGGHVNESTYTEIIRVLKSAGFKKFSTVLPVPRLKHTIFKNIRIKTSWIQRIENTPMLLKIFRSIKLGGVCPIRFNITLIAKK